MRRAIAARRMAWVVAPATILAGACSSITDLSSRSFRADTIEARLESGIVFLSMRVVPDVSMSALFEGRIIADEQGCLRLDSTDRPTVVWPRGYGFDNDGGTVRILHADGGLVGRLSDEFRVGGGEVPSLHAGLGFTDGDRDLAEAHCPGNYWIVGTD